MTGLSMVRMISHVGVRLMVRQRGGGHSTDGLQDKSREVRPGRMAGERRNIGALARGAPFAAACIFGERKTDQYSPHLACSGLGAVSNHGALQRAVAYISAIRFIVGAVARCGHGHTGKEKTGRGRAA